MDAQRLDVLDEPVDSECRWVPRCLRGAGATVVQQDQRAAIAEPAQLAEVFDGLAGTTGDTHQGGPGADHVKSQLGPVPGPKTLHGTRSLPRTYARSGLEIAGREFGGTATRKPAS